MACVRLRWTVSVRDGRPSAAAPGDRGRRDRRRPGAQARLELGPERRRGDVARHRDDRPLGPVGGSMECHDILASDGPERRLAPFRRASVRVSREHQPSQDARRDRLGVLLRTAHRRHDLLPLPRELGVLEGRPLKGIRQEIEAEPEVLPEDGEHDLARIAAPVALEAARRRTRWLGRLSCAERVVLPRVRRSAVRLARPSFSGGSRIAPASTEARTTTMGTPGRSATRTTTPFGSAKRLHAAGEDAAGRAGRTCGSRRRGERRDGSGQGEAPHGSHAHGGIIPAPSTAPAGGPATGRAARARAQTPRCSPACSARARAARG